MHAFGHANGNIGDLGGAVVAAAPLSCERDLSQAVGGDSLSMVYEQVRFAFRLHYADRLAAIL